MSLSVQIARNNNGVLTNAVTISRGVSSDSECRSWTEAWNASANYAASGVHMGYNNSAPIIRGVLRIDLVSKAEADAVKSLFTNTLRFVRPFAIVLSNAGGADLGMGAGATLNLCHLDSEEMSTADIAVPLGKGNKFTIRIPFVCLDLITLAGQFP